MSVQDASANESLSGAEKPHREPIEATRWTVGRRLWLGFAAMVVAMLMVMATGFVLARLIQMSFEVAEDAIVELEIIGEMQALSTRLVCEIREYTLSGRDEILQRVNALAAELDETIALYDSVGAEEEGHEAALEMASRLQMAATNLKTTSVNVITLYEQGAGMEELIAAKAKLVEAEIALDAVLEEVKSTMADRAKEITNTMSRVITGAYILVVTVPLIVIALAIGIAYLLHRSIVVPVTNLTETTRRVAAGDRSVRPRNPPS